ncbi:hypothetical protein SDC9_183670 [bioreactor metagenome]|uniref:Uncharacterized protein n=1 Tax=bioreactor metagenome TaxID=1076179 RepID=A0A645HKM4_9ZZZZ
MCRRGRNGLDPAERRCHRSLNRQVVFPRLADIAEADRGHDGTGGHIGIVRNLRAHLDCDIL